MSPWRASRGRVLPSFRDLRKDEGTAVTFSLKLLAFTATAWIHGVMRFPRFVSNPPMGTGAFYVIMLLSCAIPGALSAESEIGMELTESGLDADRPFVYVLEDPRSEWTIDDLTGETETATGFQLWPRINPHFGFSRSAYWLRMTFTNPTENENWILEVAHPVHDRLEFYASSEPGEYGPPAVLGDVVAERTVQVTHRFPRFAFRLAPGATRTFYLRGTSENSLAFPLSVFPYSAAETRSQIEYTALGIYFGVITVLALYVLFLFWSLRERFYLYYIVYTIATMLYSLNTQGLVSQLLGDRSGTWLGYVTIILPTISFLSSLAFARSFLDAPTRSPMADKLLKAGFVLALLPIPPMLFADLFLANQIVAGVALLVVIQVFAAGWLVMRGGYSPAVFFVFGWSWLMLSLVVFSLRSLSLVPDNLLTGNVLLVGQVVEIFLLSLGLAAKINENRRESEQERDSLLEAQRKEKEFLEQVVFERTNELQRAVSGLEEKDRVLQAELDMAASLQAGLLPANPFQWESFEIFARYEAIQKVSGDFFEFKQLEDGRLAILLADVSGHGIPAALLTTMVKISFDEACRAHRSPRKILEFMNDSIGRTLTTSDYLTAFLCILEKDGRVTYIGAGHPHAHILRANSPLFVLLKSRGMPVGVVQTTHDSYPEHEEQLHPGDRLLIFTDGLIEAEDRDMEQYGTERMRSVLQRCRDMPAEETATILLTDRAAFLEGRRAQDDTTFLIVDAR